MKENEKKLYIAYGSNMNIGQMARRCPDAEAVGWTELRGYRLRFYGADGGAVATVEPEEGSSVPVLAWEISGHDERSLDRYEGCPRMYRKETLEVELNGKTAEAMIYIMNTKGIPRGKPSLSYYRSILEGYRSAGLDEGYLHGSAFGGTRKPATPAGHVYTRNLAAEILDSFEDLLDRHGIDVPDEERTGGEGEARLYGNAYYGLLDEVEGLIIPVLTSLKKDPQTKITCYRFQ